MATGALIVVEGAEGVGKTTQIVRLADRMGAEGISHLMVREPGGTTVGDEVRRLVLDSPLGIVPRAEALLFMASRAQLVDEVIRPAVANGTFVLADRFFLSTYAYQVVGRSLDESGVRAANGFATGGLVPQLTLLLDLPIGEGIARASARSPHDRIEQSGDAFHRRVAQAFRDFADPAWQKAHPECGPLSLVDASGDADSVAERVWRVLAERWGETFAGRSESHA
jgi:dTMP kinase